MTKQDDGNVTRAEFYLGLAIVVIAIISGLMWPIWRFAYGF
jgi:hypothetical protein